MKQLRTKKDLRTKNETILGSFILTLWERTARHCEKTTLKWTTDSQSNNQVCTSKFQYIQNIVRELILFASQELKSR